MRGLSSVYTLALLTGLAPAAPLPLPKEAPPTHAGLLGTWEAEWGGGVYLITFGPGGVYGAHTPGCGGVYYTGSWWVAQNVLWVWESSVWPVEGTYLYAFTGVGGRLVGRRVVAPGQDLASDEVELVLLRRKGAR